MVQKYSNYYVYLSDRYKKDFVYLYDSYDGNLTSDAIADWNYSQSLGLKIYQMDDLLHINDDIINEWRTL